MTLRPWVRVQVRVQAQVQAMAPAPGMLGQGPQEVVEAPDRESGEVKVMGMEGKAIQLPTPNLSDALPSSRAKTREVCVATWLFRRWVEQSSARDGIWADTASQAVPDQPPTSTRQNQ